MAEAGTCTIYLNPNHPATFITRKTVGLITLTELALAVAALANEKAAMASPPLRTGTHGRHRNPPRSPIRSPGGFLRQGSLG